MDPMSVLRKVKSEATRTEMDLHPIRVVQHYLGDFVLKLLIPSPEEAIAQKLLFCHFDAGGDIFHQVLLCVIAIPVINALIKVDDISGFPDYSILVGSGARAQGPEMAQ